MKKSLESLDQPTLIAYFCRDCSKVVKGKSKGGKKKYSFLCPDCGKDVFYGTARAIIHYMRIKESSENGQILLQMQQAKLGQINTKTES